MTHLVRYRTLSGEAAAEEVDSLEDAVARVESLHNDEHAHDVHVYVEVPLHFETVVKVRIAQDDLQDDLQEDVPELADDVASVTSISSAEAAPIEPPPGSMPLTPGLFNRA